MVQEVLRSIIQLKAKSFFFVTYIHSSLIVLTSSGQIIPSLNSLDNLDNNSINSINVRKCIFMFLNGNKYFLKFVICFNYVKQSWEKRDFQTSRISSHWKCNLLRHLMFLFVGWLVGRSVSHNFLKGLEVSLPFSYRSTCSLCSYSRLYVNNKASPLGLISSVWGVATLWITLQCYL